MSREDTKPLLAEIYQAALDRLARELAAVERIDERAAAQRLEEVLKAA